MKRLLTLAVLVSGLWLLAPAPARAASINQLSNAPAITSTSLFYFVEFRGGTNYTNFAATGLQVARGLSGSNDLPLAIGESIKSYASTSAPGTTIRLGPGHYDIGTNHIHLAHGVSLVGAGQDSTFISGNGSFQTNGCIVNPGSTSLVANLTIIASNRNVYYQAPLGCAYWVGRAFTNATVRNVRLIGGTDAFYVYTNVPCSWKVFDSIAEVGWDAIAVQADSAIAHFLQFYNCDLVANMNGISQPNAVSTAKANCVAATAGRTELHGCSLIATNANDARGITVDNANATVVVKSCLIRAAGTNSAYLAANAGSGTLQIAGIDARVSETFSTITWLGNNLLLTNVVYLQAQGLAFKDSDDLNNPVWISPSGGLNVGAASDPGVASIAAGAAGGGFKVKEGANATMGTGVFSSGAATVSTTAVATNSRIMIIPVCTANVAAGASVSNIIAGTSFRVHSTSGSDANRFDWILFNPAP